MQIPCHVVVEFESGATPGQLKARVTFQSLSGFPVVEGETLMVAVGQTLTMGPFSIDVDIEQRTFDTPLNKRPAAQAAQAAPTVQVRR